MRPAAAAERDGRERAGVVRAFDLLADLRCARARLRSVWFWLHAAGKGRAEAVPPSYDDLVNASHRAPPRAAAGFW